MFLSDSHFQQYYIRRFLLSQVFSEDFFYNVNMSIGDKIKEIRLEKGLSQLKLGKSIGVSQKAIDYWERNVSEPKASYIIALVNIFEVTFDDFFMDLN